MAASILTTVLALIVWSLLIWIWMYAKRIPAMQKAKIQPNDARHPGSLDGLPSDTRQVTDNYNHLMEQPTIFYAMVFYLYLSAQADQTAILLAWTYVGLRVIHSLIQCTVNLVTMRFMVFAISTIVLMAMAARAVLALV